VIHIIYLCEFYGLDLLLPLEEISREFSITLPFLTKSPDAFADAENYMVVKSKADIPLNKFTKSCAQGLNGTDEFLCDDYPASHMVCGHYGVFQFSYPNYRVPEAHGYLRLTVTRSGKQILKLS
jgi:hypothetical protein